MELLRLGQHDEHAVLFEGFVSEVSEIAVLLVFVSLGINMPFEALNEYLLGGLVVMAVFIFVARPLQRFAMRLTHAATMRLLRLLRKFPARK